MYCSIAQYVDRFRKKQRNKEIAAIKAIKRQQILKQISTQELFRIFSPNRVNKPNTSIFAILQNCSDSLYNLVPCSNPDIEQSIINIENHTSFLRQLNRQLQNSQTNQHFELVIGYIMQIIRRYNSLQIHKQSCYQIQFIALSLLCQNHYSIEDKIFMLNWVRTVETLPLIVHIVTEVQGISCEKYSNIFKIVVLGLKSNDQYYQTYSINLFQKIIRYYDKNEIFTLYQNYPIIAVLITQRLIQKLKCRHTVVIDEWLTLLYLLNNYDEVIHGFIKAIGVYFIGQMMKSSIQSTLIGGLEILKTIASVRNSQLYEILLYDEELEIERSSNWLNLCLKNNTQSHHSIRIRKSFANVIKILIKNASFEHLRQLSKQFTNNRIDLIQYLCQIMENQQDMDIISYGIQSIQRLLLKKDNYPQSIIYNIVIYLESRNTRKRLEQLQNSSTAQVRQIIGDLLEIIDEIKKQKMQDV